jgi:hypothetical protein
MAANLGIQRLFGGLKFCFRRQKEYEICGLGATANTLSVQKQGWVSAVDSKPAS